MPGWPFKATCLKLMDAVAAMGEPLEARALEPS